MSRIDLEKFICSMINSQRRNGCKPDYHWLGISIIEALKQQGLEYKEGELVKIEKATSCIIKAGNWYVCEREVTNSNGVVSFYPDEMYYSPKDGYIDVGGALFEVGSLDAFRLATKEEERPRPFTDEERINEMAEHFDSRKPDLNVMVEEWKRRTRLYSTTEMLSYYQGLEDMWNKIQKKEAKK